MQRLQRERTSSAGYQVRRGRQRELCQLSVPNWVFVGDRSLRGACPTYIVRLQCCPLPFLLECLFLLSRMAPETAVSYHVRRVLQPAHPIIPLVSGVVIQPWEWARAVTVRVTSPLAR